ncbi:MAG: hypothetical protein ABR595_02855, partial [Psychroflexus sp.]
LHQSTRLQEVIFFALPPNQRCLARYAGRISSLMIEKYLKEKIERTDLENWILTHGLEEEYTKPYSGEPFEINQ